MKKLTTAVIALSLMASVAAPAHAQTRVCTSVYGGGEVCGETTTTVTTNVTHETVNAGLSEGDLTRVAIAMVAAGLIAMVAYRATYRWYNK